MSEHPHRGTRATWVLTGSQKMGFMAAETLLDALAGMEDVRIAILDMNLLLMYLHHRRPSDLVACLTSELQDRILTVATKTGRCPLCGAVPASSERDPFGACECTAPSVPAGLPEEGDEQAEAVQ